MLELTLYGGPSSFLPGTGAAMFLDPGLIQCKCRNAESLQRCIWYTRLWGQLQRIRVQGFMVAPSVALTVIHPMASTFCQYGSSLHCNRFPCDNQRVMDWPILLGSLNHNPTTGAVSCGSTQQLLAWGNN